MDIEIRDPAVVDWIRYHNHGKTRFIASRHFSTPPPEDRIEREADIRSVLNHSWGSVGKIVYTIANGHGASEMAAKFVMHAQEISEVFEKPCIAVCMGTSGFFSRVLNRTWTPVCSEDPRIPSAAIGQISLSQLKSLRRGNSAISRPAEYHLFGFPIDKSPSPYMHNLLFAMRNVTSECIYNSVPTSAIGEVESVIEKSEKFCGASVTIPLKERVFEYLEMHANACISGESKLAGAVNTITKMSNGTIRGDNTDIIALRQILERNPERQTVVVLGTGGAARAAIVAAKTSNIPVYLFGRDAQKVKELCDEFSIEPYESATQMSSRTVISCIPGSAQDEVLLASPFLISREDHLIEMAYIPRDTPFSKIASSVTYGWEVLLLQGIAQHEIWMNYLPRTAGTMNPAQADYKFLGERIDEISKSQ